MSDGRAQVMVIQTVVRKFWAWHSSIINMMGVAHPPPRFVPTTFVNTRLESGRESNGTCHGGVTSDARRRPPGKVT